MKVYSPMLSGHDFYPLQYSQILRHRRTPLHGHTHHMLLGILFPELFHCSHKGPRGELWIGVSCTGKAEKPERKVGEFDPGGLRKLEVLVCVPCHHVPPSPGEDGTDCCS